MSRRSSSSQAKKKQPDSFSDFMQLGRRPSRSCETCLLLKTNRQMRTELTIWARSYRRTKKPPIPRLYDYLSAKHGYDKCLSLSALREHIRNCLGIKQRA